MLRWLETMTQDLRFAFRMLGRSRGTTIVALLSLMLGIGATSAIFSVVHAVLINPYPYARPGEIWAPGVRATTGRGGHAYSLEEFLEMRKSPAFADAMATTVDNLLLTGEFTPETLTGVRVTANAFGFLGVAPVAGRTIQASDVGPDGEPAPVVVLTHKLALRLFSSEAGAVGRTLRLNDRVHTIVGVMPSRFGWYTNDGVWVPLGTSAANAPPWLNPIVRLQPGVAVASAEAQLHALNLQFARARPATFPRDGFQTRLANYLDVTVASGEMQRTLYLLLGAVGLLLLIACANVANLQLARATARSREMAVRLSMGAARGRLLRQLLTESVVLSLAGGVLGVLFAFAATRAIVALMPEFYVPNEARVTMNGTVLLFSFGLAVLTGILFGLAPAFQSSRPDLTEALKDGARGTGAGAAGGRLRSLLVVTEVTLSVVLLVSAGLTIRSFVALQQVNPGFETERLLRVGLPLAPARYATLEQRNLFAERLLERVETIPGIQAAAIGVGGLPFGGPSSRYVIGGQPASDDRTVMVNFVSADYLEALGIPLMTGRALSRDEVRRGDRVALINEAARKLWPAGEDPIGRTIRLALLERSPAPTVLLASGPPDVTVVGVVGDTRTGGLRNEPPPIVLVPYTLIAPPQRLLAIRTQGEPTAWLNAVREQVRALDPEQPLSRAMTLDELVGQHTVQPRFTMALFAFFGGLGLSLAAAGIYSVLSYHVTRRTHEIGVRLALGARRSDVIGLLLAMGCRLVAVGLVLGVVASLLVTKLLRQQLFGVTPADPLSFVAVAVVLGAVSVGACFVPARRAGGVDPIVALRHE
jgi:predicted permease